MRFIKLATISIVVLFLLMLCISSLMPSSVRISRTIDIHAPYDSIYGLINDVSRWKEWYPNYNALKTSYSINTIGEGAGITVDKTIVLIRETSKHKINTVWQTGNSVPMLGEFDFIRYDSVATVTVQWLFIQKVKWYPWEKFAAILSDKAIGPFMEQGLDNLKKRGESFNLQ